MFTLNILSPLKSGQYLEGAWQLVVEFLFVIRSYCCGRDHKVWLVISAFGCALSPG